MLKLRGLAVLALVASFVVVGLAAEGRYAMRHSFKGPFEPDSAISFWEAGAGAKVSDGYVRLTPARQSRTGFFWNTIQSTMVDWEVEIEFQCTGQPTLGGDGLAFWYTADAQMLGPVYGSMDFWNGLGIFFDTFNNDGVGDHPAIVAIMNDGTIKYDHAQDGRDQAMGSCAASLRNGEKPSVARIRYQNQRLEVTIAEQVGGVFEPCFEIPDLELGIDKYYGLTAHTGDVADNHDIFRFEARDLTTGKPNLEQVRHKYRDRARAQTERVVHHEELNNDEYQQSVLAHLNQIQSTTNVVEQTTLEVARAVADIKSTVESNRGSAPAPPAASRSSHDNNNNNGGGGGAPGSVSTDELKTMIDNLKRSVADMANNSPKVQSAAADARTFAKSANDGVGGIKQELARLSRDLKDDVQRALSNFGGNDGDMAAAGFGVVTVVLSFLVGMFCGGGVMFWRASQARNSFKLP